MSTSAERQRKRRERMRQQGYVDVTVPVLKSQAKALRLIAKNLSNGLSMPIEAGRLLDVIHALKSIKSALEDVGVKHAGVFGSTARGEYSPDSDIDILIDIDTKRVGDVLRYVEVTDIIKKAITTKLPEVDVDVADYATLKPRVRKQAEFDAIYAF